MWKYRALLHRWTNSSVKQRPVFFGYCKTYYFNPQVSVPDYEFINKKRNSINPSENLFFNKFCNSIMTFCYEKSMLKSKKKQLNIMMWRYIMCKLWNRRGRIRVHIKIKLSLRSKKITQVWKKGLWNNSILKWNMEQQSAITVKKYGARCLSASYPKNLWSNSRSFLLIQREMYQME